MQNLRQSGGQEPTNWNVLWGSKDETAAVDFVDVLPWDALMSWIVEPSEKPIAMLYCNGSRRAGKMFHSAVFFEVGSHSSGSKKDSKNDNRPGMRLERTKNPWAFCGLEQRKLTQLAFGPSESSGLPANWGASFMVGGHLGPFFFFYGLWVKQNQLKRLQLWVSILHFLLWKLFSFCSPRMRHERN